MFTIAFLTRRIPTLSVEEFFHHYESVHAPLAALLPGLVNYQQMRLHHGVESWKQQPESFPDYDALSLYTFLSRDDADDAFASAEGRALEADTAVVIHEASILGAPCTHLGTVNPAEVKVK